AEEVEESYRVEILKRPAPKALEPQRRLSDASSSLAPEPTTMPATADYMAALDPRVRKLRTAREEEETLKRWKQRLSRYHVARRKIMKTPPERLLKENQEFRRRQRLGLVPKTAGDDTVLKAETITRHSATDRDDHTSKETTDDWTPKRLSRNGKPQCVRFNPQFSIAKLGNDGEILSTETVHETYLPEGPKFTLTRIPTYVCGFKQSQIPLDTCATTNIVSKRYLDRLAKAGVKTEIRPLAEPRLARGLGGLNPMLGNCTLNIALGETRVKGDLDFYVINDDFLTILLGNPTLHHFNMTVDFSKEVVSFPALECEGGGRHNIPMTFMEAVPKKPGVNTPMAFYSKREV
ncbi:hypothetical protein HDU96_005402, partial [Phlyctochytrium bullatum]